MSSENTQSFAQALDEAFVKPATAEELAWKLKAGDLAQWTLDHLVNRTDAYGINNADGTRSTGHGVLSKHRLELHFRNHAIIGVHLISRENTCKTIKIDIDAHGEGDTTELAARNLEIALVLFRRADELGLNPILSDSNGKGGFHFEIIFANPIPAKDAYHFGIWLARGYNPNKTGGIEVYPKRPDRNTEKGFGGGWVRVYGKHHKRNHWTKIYSHEGVWLEGIEAVKALLSHAGDDPAVLANVDYMPKVEPSPPPPRLPPPPRPNYVNPQDHLDRCFNALLRLETQISETGFTRLFAGACRCVEYDLTDGEAMEVLRRWLVADPLPYPWTDSDFAQKLRDANKRAERGKANRPLPTMPHFVNGFSNGHADRTTQPDEPTRNLDDYRKDMVQARMDSVLLPGTINFDGSPTGAGKTTADIPAVKMAGSSLTVIPTHRNAEEVETTYNQAGIDAVAYPPLNRDTCQNLDEATKALACGLSASSSVCLSCQFRKACEYQEVMQQAEGASHRIATHKRTELSFGSLAKGRAYVTLHEDPTNMLRPTAEIRSGLDMVATVSQHASHRAADRGNNTARHHYWKMEECCYWLAGQLEHATATENLVLPIPAGKLFSVDSDLWASIVDLNIYPSADAMRIIKAMAAGDLHEVAIRVDQVFAPGREKQTHKAILAIWKTKLPNNSVIWINDATGSRQDIEEIIGRPVIDRTPGGTIARRHRVVQIPMDITQSTGARRLLVVFQAVMQAFPKFNRIGVVCHRRHTAIINGTAKHGPVLDESQRRRISKVEYFRGGENRASNHWTEECDFLIVAGTPRVPPSVVRTHLLRIGRHEAAALDIDAQGWTRQTWTGTTEAGQPCNVTAPGYANIDWVSAHHALVHAELMQTVGRGRAICENGIPVAVLTNENLGFPILELEIDAGIANDSDFQVLSALRELNDISPTGFDGGEKQELNDILPIYIIAGTSFSSCTFGSPIPSSAIAEKVGICPRTTIRILNRLLARKLVVKHGERGGWSLPLVGNVTATCPPTMAFNTPSDETPTFSINSVTETVAGCVSATSATP